MPPRDDYNHAARKRTATVPQKLRTELEQLGHLPPNSNNPRKSRKERRKDKRTQPKLNRKLAHEAHPASTRKRPADDDHHAASTSTAPSSTSSSSRTPPAPPAKRTKVAHPPPDADSAATATAAAPQTKTTALERRLAKQERGTGPDPRTRTKDPAATDEDREIAWLEAKLGLQQKALTSAERGRMRSEFDDDGLGGVSPPLSPALSTASFRPPRD